MYYEKVFKALEENKVRYAVRGGVALVLHGVVRFTADLDLIVELNDENLKRFLKAMSGAGYRPMLPVEADEFLDPLKRKVWREKKNMVVFSFIEPEQPMSLVDVFLDEKIPFGEIDHDRVTVTARGITIPVVSIAHLKRLKRIAGRPQDLADIEALESVQKEG